MSDFRYTPRSVGIIKLHDRTMAPASIATIMRCSVGTIEIICRKHGIEMLDRDEPLPTLREIIDERTKRKNKLDVSVDDLTLTGINMEARRRGMSRRELVSALITNVVEDRLYTAVLGQ